MIAAEYLVNLPRELKRTIALASDVFCCVLSVQIAFYLRLGEWQSILERPLYSTVATVVLAIPLFIVNGLYRAIFRFSFVSAIVAILKAIILFSIPFVTLFTFFEMPHTPRTIGIIEPILLFLLVAGSRAIVHWWLGTLYMNQFIDHSRPRTLIYGVNDAAIHLASAIHRNHDVRLVGFVDEDGKYVGSTIEGRRVYSPSELAVMLETRQVDEVLVALPNMSRARRMKLVDELTRFGARARLLPPLIDIVRGRVSISDLKHVEIEDILSRKSAPLDELLLENCLYQKVIMVTGAGGSIGSELCRQILSYGPKRLVLVDSAEYNLYAIESELAQRIAGAGSDVQIVAELATVRNLRRMEALFAAHCPATIFHAAAYKHVPLIEANPLEGLENNVIGTWNVADLASKHRAQYCILVSTDKAVRPTNVMGATKRMAELVIQGFAQQANHTKFAMVRFGNVLGSSGSVVPLFRKQIASGGPITLTHPDMTRYFMTIPEAAQLVIQAGAMATGGEVFLLDMGTPVRIVDLARNMIQLSGLTVRDEHNPEGDIPIKFVGIRPGEKLYEELLIGDSPELTPHASIMKAQEVPLPFAHIAELVGQLKQSIETQDSILAFKVLKACVPEYQPSSDQNKQDDDRSIKPSGIPNGVKCA